METTAKDKNPKRKSSVPAADIEMKDIAIKVINPWKNSKLNLQWIKIADFETIVNNYSSELEARMNTGAGRKPLTQQLKDVDKEIDKHLNNLKNYISDKYGKKQAPTYFAEFGIEYNGKAYKIPQDRNRRKNALQMLIGAISKHQLENQKYGLAYWQDIVHRFNQLIDQANKSDSSVSASVSNKNQLKPQVKEVLKSLIFLIKANYPKTWKATLREWGFQKEKY